MCSQRYSNRLIRQLIFSTIVLVVSGLASADHSMLGHQVSLSDDEFPPRPARALASADFDSDGKPDLMVSYHQPNGEGVLAIRKGLFATGWWVRSDTSNVDNSPFSANEIIAVLPQTPTLLGAADFDADGLVDAVATTQGSEELWFLRGKGNGHFDLPRMIALAGEVTAFYVADINRRDGLDDLMVAVDGPDGPELLVFEGPGGAINSVAERISLPETSTSLSSGRLDADWGEEIAVAVGNRVMVIHGRDRKLSFDQAAREGVGAPKISTWEMSTEIAGLVIANVLGDYNQDLIAVLADGVIETRRGPISPTGQSEPGLLARWSDKGVLLGQNTPKLTVLAIPAETGHGSEVMVVDHSRGQIITSSGKPDERMEGVSETSANVVYEVLDNTPAGVLPMRLGASAGGDLIIAGDHGLSVAVSGPLNIFTVNSVADAGDNNTADSVCDTGGLVDADPECTLRAAIQQANALAGLDQIHFSIPGVGPHTIQPGSALPSLTEQVVMDGSTEPDFTTTPVIEIDGNLAGPGVNGLRLTGGGITLRSLAINRFKLNSGTTGYGVWISAGDGNLLEGNHIGTDPAGVLDRGNANYGIRIDTADNVIGGTTAQARNLISGNFSGVQIFDAGATGNRFEGNYIGTTVDGNSGLGNGSGISIFGGAASTIGGTTAGAGNLVSGNDENGLYLASSDFLVQGNLIGTGPLGLNAVPNAATGVFIAAGTEGSIIGGTTVAARNIVSGQSGSLDRGFNLTGGTNVVIQGNYVGVDISGSAPLGNGIGIQVSGASTSHAIGGTVAGAANIISANLHQGMLINNTTAGMTIQGNSIGTDASATVNLGNANQGIAIFFSSNNTIGGTDPGAGNVIAFNGVNNQSGATSGVSMVSASTGNAILGNAIFSNVGLGIDIEDNGVTANDAGDGDAGGNNRQNFPVLSSAETGSTTVNGTFNSNADTTYRIELFASSSCDASGFGEAEVFLGAQDLSTDNSGNAIVDITVSATAPEGAYITATATDPANNTSEFSQCVQLPTDNDFDDDGILDEDDNCPMDFNPLQQDIDEDGIGTVCDICPADPMDACNVDGSIGLEIDRETGGEVETPDGIVHLDFEPFDLPYDETISITQVELGDDGVDLLVGGGAGFGRGKALAVYDLEPDGLNFDPATVTLTVVFDVSDLNPGQRTHLDLYVENGMGGFDSLDAICNIVEAPASVFTATCIAEISHFTMYALVAPLDTDNDGIFDNFDGVMDNCAVVANPGQEDEDMDGSGDACDIFSNGFEDPI